MKKNVTLIFFFLTILFLAGSYPVHAIAETEKTPTAVAIEPQFEFQPAIEGQKILHDYLIRNTGTAVLEIKDVKTSCGCTTAGIYSREILPGKEGRIPIKVDTNHYGGTQFERDISVFTNDPKNPRLALTISGEIEKFVTLDPDRVVLSGEVGSEIKATAKIILEQKYPFKIKNTKAEIGENISYKLKKNKKKGEIGYILYIKNTAKTKNRYFDEIVMETDSKIHPKISIKVFGNIIEKKPVEINVPNITSKG